MRKNVPTDISVSKNFPRWYPDPPTNLIPERSPITECKRPGCWPPRTGLPTGLCFYCTCANPLKQ